ncbi:nuclear transport factor 2 family protein [Planctomonas sp. JC2975]|uniref:nuclear transport factor 2 family protein n=1 Tax=Planctomonas sp. JC2975 TaxID=2729626 RepID=UPI0014758E92|nr:nuclear transport factor 2 family protein [Planctomonas sp. JC2975]NNC12002.1 nuclear transport factor 2 family protein [Planctomonas sp. JC2975]
MPSISAALHELLGERDLPLESVLQRHFTDDYRQSTGGEWIDRAVFAEQMTQLRAFVDHVDIEVVAEVAQGSAYAERHIIRVTQPDGSVLAQEAFVFASVADDGRFKSLEELVRPVPAS